jgi:hypothetical protein
MEEFRRELKKLKICKSKGPSKARTKCKGEVSKIQIGSHLWHHFKVVLHRHSLIMERIRI